ncbi:Ribosomal RNA-processing protein 7 [Lunasporangiospora selenospora]|uniref:Ribosomal RNA-processing protein 7 n=1 Tax=Lunasporangiospora selenospora TaxID=979761 RepID=A0A9P6FYN3_9FUNG|nr:Ribosomal RNA-processing protein 7 [Lunasporangiospora selenospora]
MVKKTKKSESGSNGGSDSLDLIANFFILPLHMPALATTAPASSTPAQYKNVLHYLYFKKHESPKEDRRTPKDRTLFVLNVPSDATESHFRDLFKPYGRVAAVHFINRVRDTNMTKDEREHQEELEHLEREAALKEAEEKAKKNKKGGKKQQPQLEAHSLTRTILGSGSQAFVVFLEEQELTKVLGMKKKSRTWLNEASNNDEVKLSSLGLTRWMQEYHRKRPEASELQAKVDEYMEKFERSEYETQQAALARLNTMDDDGFTLVTRTGNKGYNTDGVIKITAAKAEDIENIKPKKKKELQDFYRFQMREAKRDKLVELRRKFEEDKVRIEALKDNRRFKPY